MIIVGRIMRGKRTGEKAEWKRFRQPRRHFVDRHRGLLESIRCRVPLFPNGIHFSLFFETNRKRRRRSVLDRNRNETNRCKWSNW